jgi:hypothetical protein
MMMGGWNNNVKQWWGGSDGVFYASGGNLKIDETGIRFNNTQDGILFYSGNDEVGSLVSNINTSSDLEIRLSFGATNIELIRNGSFTESVVSFWTKAPSPGSWDISTTVYHSSPASAYGTMGTYPYESLSCIVPVSEGVAYDFNYWQKVDVLSYYGPSIRLHVIELDEDRVPLAGEYALDVFVHYWDGGSQDWASKSYNFTTQSGTRYLKVMWWTSEWGGGYKLFYIDNVSLKTSAAHTSIILDSLNTNYHAEDGEHIFWNDADIKGNLVVEGTIKDGSGIAYLKSTGKASDSDKLDGLDSTDFGRPVFLTTPLTSTSWDGDSFSTTSKTLIDLSAVFGAPAGIKAVLLFVGVKDIGSANTDTYFIVGPTNVNYAGMACQPGEINDRVNRCSIVVPCDANGDIYYQIGASGAGTFGITMQIWGYWL